jgi:hypothetical protein
MGKLEEPSGYPVRSPCEQVGAFPALWPCPFHWPSLILYQRISVGRWQDWSLPEQCDWKNSTWTYLFYLIWPKQSPHQINFPFWGTSSGWSTSLPTSGKLSDSLLIPASAGWLSSTLSVKWFYRAKWKAPPVLPWAVSLFQGLVVCFAYIMWFNPRCVDYATWTVLFLFDTSENKPRNLQELARSHSSYW